MLVLPVAVAAQKLAHERRRQLAARRFDGADLVAGGFNCARFMDVDMAGIGGDHALPRAKRGGDDRRVGDRAADHKVHVRLRAGKARTDDAARLGAEIVHAVAAGRDKVIFLKCGEHLRVRTLGIIIAERDHGKARPYFRFYSDCRAFGQKSQRTACVFSLRRGLYY